MAEVDPLKPGKIAGQNPNTPERLQGEMNVDADRVPNSTARLVSLVVIPAAIILAVIVVYFTMLADPGARPEGDQQQKTQGQP